MSKPIYVMERTSSFTGNSHYPQVTGVKGVVDFLKNFSKPTNFSWMVLRKELLKTNCDNDHLYLTEFNNKDHAKLFNKFKEAYEEEDYRIGEILALVWKEKLGTAKGVDTLFDLETLEEWFNERNQEQYVSAYRFKWVA